MNELMITLGGNWIYFDTNCDDAEIAYKEFQSTCENVGINVDNIKPDSVVLRKKGE